MKPTLSAGLAGLALAGAVGLLAACGSDPGPQVVVVPQAQPAPSTTTVVPAQPSVVEQPRYTVVPPGSRVVCTDGRAPPC